jgi:hypothetical protein
MNRKTVATITTEELLANGLGDCIAALTSKLGIKPCKACKRRQKTLNAIKLPFKVSMKLPSTGDE